MLPDESCEVFLTKFLRAYDAAGNALSRQQLSEGEKQIIAVAMLWGLARASARPLPAVIDTPMARLDAAHRGHDGKVLGRQFRLHLHRGIAYLAAPHAIRSLAGLVRLAVESPTPQTAQQSR